jgi:hypothetical protein
MEVFDQNSLLKNNIPRWQWRKGQSMAKNMELRPIAQNISFLVAGGTQQHSNMGKSPQKRI